MLAGLDAYLWEGRRPAADVAILHAEARGVPRALDLAAIAADPFPFVERAARRGYTYSPWRRSFRRAAPGRWRSPSSSWRRWACGPRAALPERRVAPTSSAHRPRPGGSPRSRSQTPSLHPSTRPRGEQRRRRCDIAMAGTRRSGPPADTQPQRGHETNVHDNHEQAVQHAGPTLLAERLVPIGESRDDRHDGADEREDEDEVRRAREPRVVRHEVIHVEQRRRRCTRQPSGR